MSQESSILDLIQLSDRLVEFVNGLVVRAATHQGIGEARAAAERTAKAGG